MEGLDLVRRIGDVASQLVHAYPVNQIDGAYHAAQPPKSPIKASVATQAVQSTDDSGR